MKSMLLWVAILAFPVIVIAQVVGLPVPVTNEDFFQSAIAAFQSVKGAPTLVIVGVLIQLLLKFMSTPLFDSWFKNLSPQSKLTIILGLTIPGGLISLVTVDGLSWGAALVNSTMLAAYSVFANQLYGKYLKKT